MPHRASPLQKRTMARRKIGVTFEKRVLQTNPWRNRQVFGTFLGTSYGCFVWKGASARSGPNNKKGLE